MRIIDKTPLIEEDGSISSINRIRGTIQYGFSWYPDLEAQQKAISILGKHLGKKFTLIRNLTLGKSKITVPLILIGPSGVQIIFVTHLDGTYRAKNDSWGTIANGKFKESAINLLKRTAQLGKAVQVYLERKDFNLPGDVEPILLSVNPGLHVESVRPIVRTVMSDAAERFAATLAQKPPAISVELIHQMAEELVNPSKAKAPTPEAQADDVEEAAPQQFAPEQNISSPEDMGDIGFAFEDEAPAQAPPPAPKPRQAARRPAKKTSQNDYFGMTGKQIAIIGVMGLILVCFLVLAILGALFFL